MAERNEALLDISEATEEIQKLSLDCWGTATERRVRKNAEQIEEQAKKLLDAAARLRKTVKE